jgi:putative membrane protein
MGWLQRFLLGWAANVLALWAAVWLVGDVTVSGYGTLIVSALVFTVVNLIVKPIVTLLGFPVILLTLGLALFLVNMLMFALTAWLVPDLEVGGFWSVAKGTIVIWLVNVLVGIVLRGARGERD